MTARRFSVLLFAWVLAVGAFGGVPRVLFDTDMFADFDDVGALAMLHALADAGECEIAAIGCNTWGDGNCSVAECEVVNAYYGRPDVPIGCARSGGMRGAGKRGHGLPEKYPQWVKHRVSTDAPPAVDVYRAALAASPDKSVVLCSVGFLNNVAELLKADRALVERKVRLWVCMACQYPKGKEYNSRFDAPASAYAFENWPASVPIVWTDYSYGRTCYAGRAVAELPDNGNPVRDAFAKMLSPREKVVPGSSWDQLAGHPSWDETAVLIAVRGWERYFNLERGFYRMVGTEGEDVWTADAASSCGRVTEKLTKAEVGKVMDELMCRPPRRVRSTAVNMDDKAKVLRTVPTAHAGVAEVTCDDTAGWTFDATASEDAGRDVLTVKLMSPTNALPPRFGVFFRVSGKGVRNVWNADFTRDGAHFRPQLWWRGTAQQKAHLSNDMPLAVGYDEAGVSRAAIACSEAFECVIYGLYADDRTCEAVGRCEFFTETAAPRKEYVVKVLFDRRGKAWSDVVRESADWISSVNGFAAADVPEAAYDPLYSTWYAYLQDVHADELEREAKLAASLGMKTMILDDGWQKNESVSFYSATGDWMPVTNRFPDIRAHVAAVHRAGLKYMAWLSVPHCGDETKAWDLFKDKMLRIRGTETGPGRVGVLDPRFPEVREYLIRTYERAVGEWGFDGLKLDFIDSFTFRDPDPAPAEGFRGRDYRSLPEAVNRLMTDVNRRLKAIRPDVLIEFRQPYIGPAVRQYGNMLRAADCPADLTANRRRICDLRLTSGRTAVHSDMLVWSKDETPEGAAQSILNVLFSTIQYSMVLEGLRDDHRAVIRHWLDFSQRHRDALLKGGFRPHHPENGYTWVEGESASERIIAVYSGDACARTGSLDREVHLVNATSAPSVLVELEGAPAKVEFFDVVGRPVGEAKPNAGLVRLAVPPSGYARIVPSEPASRRIAEPIQYWTPAGTNSWVGDVTAIRFKDRFHVFYLYDEHHHQAFGGKGGHIFKHLSSPDLKAWEEHPIAVGRDEPWEWIGTGTPLVKDGKLCLFYGLHSSRNGEGWKKKYPKGGTYAVSEDGIHFTKSHDIFTDDENPSPFWMDDGRIGIIHSGFSADKGWFAADRLAGPWSLVDDKMPTEGDCPCPFSWNGWHYVIQGFVTMAGSPTGKPGSYEDWVLAGDDVYGGLSVPMVADWKDGRRILVGWINGIDRYHEVPKGWNLQVWGGWLCFRELVQFPDGRLGTKWLEETPNRGETRTYACSPDKPFVLDFRTVRGERLEFRIDPQEARAQFSSDGTRKRTLAEVSRGLDMSKGKRIGQIAAGHLNAPYTAQDYAIGKIRGLDRPFTVRFSVHYDPKADGTIFDAEIAGTRTMVARAAGRFEPVRKD